MKRFITILLALAMLASMGSVAYAEDSSKTITDLETDNSANFDVGGTYAASTEPDPVYFVTVSWESMEFNCEITGSKDWNVDTHTYTNRQRFSWKRLDNKEGTEKTRTITVTNKSNKQVKVNADVSYASENSYGFTLSLFSTSETGILETLADNGVTKDDIKELISVTIGGGPAQPPLEGFPEKLKIGTVTITVAAASTELQ